MTKTETSSNLKGIVAIFGSEKAKGVCDIHAAGTAMRSASPSDFDRLCELAEQTTFTTRRYGSQWYCWPHHELLGLQDPWPGSRFPKAVLCVQFAMELSAIARTEKGGRE